VVAVSLRKTFEGLPFLLVWTLERPG